MNAIKLQKGRHWYHADHQALATSDTPERQLRLELPRLTHEQPRVERRATTCSSWRRG